MSTPQQQDFRAELERAWGEHIVANGLFLSRDDAVAWAARYALSRAIREAEKDSLVLMSGHFFAGRLRALLAQLGEENMNKRIELGCAGHFIAVSDCRWRRHTQVPGYRISSVGDYFPLIREKRERRTIGAGKDAFYETMVFKTTGAPEPESEGCGCEVVAEWSEIEVRRYATTGEAQKGHEELVEKYLALKGKAP